MDPNNKIDIPEILAPENSLSGIRSVFGADWQPSAAFTPELQNKGIYGAARIIGTNEVYTLGTGGTKETAESFLQKFGTAEQKGIVGEITKEQAIQLGITDTKQTPMDSGITTESLARVGDTIDISTSEPTDDASTFVAGATKYIEDAKRIAEATKSDKEKALEKSEEDIFGQITKDLTTLEGAGAEQLAEEEKAGIPDIQKQRAVIQGDIGVKMAEYNQLQTDYDKVEQFLRSQPVSTAYISGQRTQAQNQLAIKKNALASEIGILQAQDQSLAGQQTTAQNTVNRAIDLKYSVIEQRIKTQEFLLNSVQGKLTKEQQIRADALSNYYTQQKIELADQKATEKATYNTLLSQMNQYPDAGISITDTLEQANTKIATNSKIYAKQIRPPVGSGANDLNWQTSTAGGLLGLDKSTASKFDTDLEQEINAVESGAYGREGARERALEKLRTKYPGISNQQWDEIIYTGSDTLYPAFPDGYESKIGKTEGEKEAIKQAEKEKRNYSDQGVRDLISSGAKRKISRAAIKSEALKSSALTDADKERFSFILDEMWTEGQKKINKQWR